MVKFLQRLGLPLGTIHVLTVPGRVSGAPRATPVSPLTVDGRRYVIAGLPQADWARNARASGRAVLSRGRRNERVELREVRLNAGNGVLIEDFDDRGQSERVAILWNTPDRIFTVSGKLSRELAVTVANAIE